MKFFLAQIDFLSFSSKIKSPRGKICNKMTWTCRSALGLALCCYGDGWNDQNQCFQGGTAAIRKLTSGNVATSTKVQAAGN
jgi:hypothetical protein